MASVRIRPICEPNENPCELLDVQCIRCKTRLVESRAVLSELGWTVQYTFLANDCFHECQNLHRVCPACIDTGVVAPVFDYDGMCSREFPVKAIDDTRFAIWDSRNLSCGRDRRDRYR